MIVLTNSKNVRLRGPKPRQGTQRSCFVLFYPSTQSLTPTRLSNKMALFNRIGSVLTPSISQNSVSELFVGGYSLLKDVHTGIPSSGVSGGFVSLVQGSYEYHHYLQEGFDDSGWGCAIFSNKARPIFAVWMNLFFRQITSVTCKVMNVRSGAELPEKCRELALHFENQGTPIIIGGGVLAYTLLGVDYNDVNGDCAFLILDLLYTCSEDLQKIVNDGWCEWKKAVDSKGKSFSLADKFYNLLMPQRPNMV